MKPGPRNGRLIRGCRQVGGGPRTSSTNYAQFGTLIADYNPVNATASGGRVTLVTEPVNGFNAQPNVADTGPTLTTSASYGNKPVFLYNKTAPVAGSERLVTTAGLGAAIGTSAWTLVFVGHTTQSVASNRYAIMHLPGSTNGFYSAGSNTHAFMYGPSGDVEPLPAVTPTSPSVMAMVFTAAGLGSIRQGLASPSSLPGNIGAPNCSGEFVIGSWKAPADAFNWDGPVARILFYLGDIGSANTLAVNTSLISEYSL